MKTIHKGFIATLLLTIIAILIIGGGTYVYMQFKQADLSAYHTNTQATSTATQSSTQLLTAQPTSGLTPLKVRFSISGGPYRIDFGDGAGENVLCTQDTICQNGVSSISHTYTSAGTYSAHLFPTAVLPSAKTVVAPIPPPPLSTVKITVRK